MHNEIDNSALSLEGVQDVLWPDLLLIITCSWMHDELCENTRLVFSEISTLL